MVVTGLHMGNVGYGVFRVHVVPPGTVFDGATAVWAIFTLLREPYNA